MDTCSTHLHADGAFCFCFLQYVRWAGVPIDAFWTDVKAKQLYMNHVRMLANRRNVYTG